MEKRKYESNNYIWEILHDLVPFDKFKKREKHPWRSATFSNFTKGNTLAWVFFTFFKLYKWYQIAQRITYKSLTYINISYMRFTSTSKNEVLILCFRKIRKMIRESKNIGMCLNFFFFFKVTSSIFYTYFIKCFCLRLSTQYLYQNVNIS